MSNYELRKLNGATWLRVMVSLGIAKSLEFGIARLARFRKFKQIIINNNFNKDDDLIMRNFIALKYISDNEA